MDGFQTEIWTYAANNTVAERIAEAQRDRLAAQVRAQSGDGVSFMAKISAFVKALAARFGTGTHTTSKNSPVTAVR